MTTTALTDSEKLLALALWFDTWDTDRATAARILTETGNQHEVQDDLRRMADALPKLLAVVAAAREALSEADQVTGRLIGVPRRNVEALAATLAALDEEGKR